MLDNYSDRLARQDRGRERLKAEYPQSWRIRYVLTYHLSAVVLTIVLLVLFGTLILSIVVDVTSD